MALTAATSPLVGETPQQRLGRLFEAQHQRLYRLALRLARDGGEARDLVQEAFLRAARRPGALPAASRGRGFPGAGGGESLPTAIAARRCAAALPPTTRRRPDSPPDAAVLARPPCGREIASLPPRRRAVVVLAELEERSTAEIAALLGIARVTVRAGIWRPAAGGPAALLHGGRTMNRKAMDLARPCGPATRRTARRSRRSRWPSCARRLRAARTLTGRRLASWRAIVAGLALTGLAVVLAQRAPEPLRPRSPAAQRRRRRQRQRTAAALPKTPDGTRIVWVLSPDTPL
jgi:DNA-directed RNA polymerase specialized sigma24 family protein